MSVDSGFDNRQTEFLGGLFLRGVHRYKPINGLVGMKPEGGPKVRQVECSRGADSGYDVRTAKLQCQIAQCEQADILLDTIDASAQKTADNTGLTLQLAVNYGGRQEIVDAARAMAQRVAAGDLKLDEVNEEAFAGHLYRPEAPDPDLLVRTGGDMRISNYLLWEVAYAEIWVTPTLWPDFRKAELYRAIVDYQGRQRRFGRVEGAA